MGQTKRKRRTKHRGNAAGRIEARGRTGRKPDPVDPKTARAQARQARANRPPSWKGALGKAAFGAVMLFFLMQLGVLGSKATVVNSLTVAVFAMVAYTPIMYATDRFIYNRKLRAQQRT